MKVVALVSGGKDSCYAMMRCIDYGHEIVALANLLPLDDSVDELDSYMYQTVGHQIVTSYAECMGLPLFRRRIRGSTKHHALGYSVTQGDEVEDMYVLLNEVKKQIPSVMAVSSGAIASDYQRLRVESVCSRLGLVSLAYLWKQDQTFLLEEMIRRGIIAITIKVAAIGLNPAKHLGKELVDLQDYLLRLKEAYGINVCGEGGEYETLTLDCPIFRNARILLDESQVVLHSPDNIAPVGILHPLGFHIEHKEQSLSPSNCNSDINKEGSKYIFEVEGDYVTDNSVNSKNLNLACNEEITKKLSISMSKGRSDFFSISCWVDGIPKTLGLQEDLTAILSKIELQLIENGFDWANVLYVHLYISNMKDFALANEIYVSFITQKKCYMGVPSRSTIELPLLQVGLGNAYVEVLVANDHSKRVLHVQSISCWAPSCIGPYSQATLHKEVLYMAGQLGLDPPTMMLHSGGAAMEMEQALLNCEAVANCFNTSLASATVLVVYCSISLLAHELSGIQQQMEVFVGKCSDKQNLDGVSNPMPLYILVPALPKGALVEIKPVIHIPEDGCNEAEHRYQQESCHKKDHLAFSYMEWHDSCYQIYTARGKICLALVSVTQDLALKICNTEDVHLSPKDHMKDVAKFCFYILDKILQENGFFWEDIKHLKFYYTTSLGLAADFLERIFLEKIADLIDVYRSISTMPNFSLIPVLASGRSTSMDDIITCELFASKF